MGGRGPRDAAPCPSKQQHSCGLTPSGDFLCKKKVKGRTFSPSSTKPGPAKPKVCGRRRLSEAKGAPDGKPQHAWPAGSGSGDRWGKQQTKQRSLPHMTHRSRVEAPADSPGRPLPFPRPPPPRTARFPRTGGATSSSSARPPVCKAGPLPSSCHRHSRPVHCQGSLPPAAPLETATPRRRQRRDALPQRSGDERPLGSREGASGRVRPRAHGGCGFILSPRPEVK